MTTCSGQGIHHELEEKGLYLGKLMYGCQLSVWHKCLLAVLWILAFYFSLTTNVLVVKQAIYICAEMFIFDKSTVSDNKIKQKSIFTGEFLGSPHSQCSQNCLYTTKSFPQAQICSSSYLMEFACVCQGAEFGSWSKTRGTLFKDKVIQQ